MIKKISLLIAVCLCLVGCGETATLLDFLPADSSDMDLNKAVLKIGTETNADEETPSSDFSGYLF